EQLLAHLRGRRYAGKPAGRKLQAWFGKYEARARRPRGHVHLGVNEVHAAFECAARISIHSERRSVADLDACEVVLKDLSKNPNGRKIAMPCPISLSSQKPACTRWPIFLPFDLSKNPNGRKIGQRVQAGFWLDREIGQGIAFGDVARDCRIDLELLLHLPG